MTTLVELYNFLEKKRDNKHIDSMFSYDRLTAAKLSEQIQFFSKSWLEEYGHLLPREHMMYEDEDGVVHKTSWCYPLHRIQRMIVEDKLYFHIDSLKKDKKETP